VAEPGVVALAAPEPTPKEEVQLAALQQEVLVPVGPERIPIEEAKVPALQPETAAPASTNLVQEKEAKLQPETAAPASPEPAAKEDLKPTALNLSNVASPQRCGDSPSNIKQKTSQANAVQTVTVTFSVPYQTCFGEEIRVIGNVAALGQWDPSAAPAMQWTDGHVWVTTVDLELPPAASGKENQEPSTGKPLEYKYVLMSHGQVNRWESCLNRCLSHPNCGSSLVCHNVWNDVNSIC
jgi:hypothetical protein